MSLEGVKSFVELKRKNFWNEAKMHPPPRKLKGENTSKIFIKINEPRMIKFRSMVKHEFRPSFIVIIIAIGNVKARKDFGRGGMISLVFFKNNFVKIKTVEE